MTPLVLAVLKQSPKLLNMLMTAGADPNLANKVRPVNILRVLELSLLL